MIMYKILTREEVKLVSWSTIGKYKLIYKPQEWTKPKIGKIFVFDSLKNALKLKHLEEDEIWKVEVKNIEKPLLIADTLTLSNEDKQIEAFWTGKHAKTTKGFPKGTYLTDSVKLIERVM